MKRVEYEWCVEHLEENDIDIEDLDFRDVGELEDLLIQLKKWGPNHNRADVCLVCKVWDADYHAADTYWAYVIDGKLDTHLYEGRGGYAELTPARKVPQRLMAEFNRATAHVQQDQQPIESEA